VQAARVRNHPWHMKTYQVLNTTLNPYIETACQPGTTLAAAAAANQCRVTSQETDCQVRTSSHVTTATIISSSWCRAAEPNQKKTTRRRATATLLLFTPCSRCDRRNVL
jgi:hypothetical protein